LFQVKKNKTKSKKLKGDESFVHLKQIALFIKTARFCYNLTQKDLAAESDVSFRTIQNIEAGDLNYTIKNLIKVISVFNLELSSFFNDML
jgi:transcriptional regulator with XRE-family HTH domain